MVMVQSNGRVPEVTTECGVRFFSVSIRPFGQFVPQSDSDAPKGGIVGNVTGDFESAIDAVESVRMKNAFLLSQQKGQPVRVWFVLLASRLEPESGDEVAFDLPLFSYA